MSQDRMPLDSKGPSRKKQMKKKPTLSHIFVIFRNTEDNKKTLAVPIEEQQKDKPHNKDPGIRLAVEFPRTALETGRQWMKPCLQIFEKECFQPGVLHLTQLLIQWECRIKPFSARQDLNIKTVDICGSSFRRKPLEDVLHENEGVTQESLGYQSQEQRNPSQETGVRKPQERSCT